MPHQVDVLQFVVERSPKRVVVFDASHNLVYQSPSARKFLERDPLPEDIRLLTKRLFRAIALKNAAEMFPGQICFAKEIGGRRWIFLVEYREGENPLVCLYFSEETVSGVFDMNSLRNQYRLTRRESDALRHMLDGLSNVEIAEELGITSQTVKDYLSAIYAKVGVRDRFSLLRRLLSAR